jgi:hypothetical protein
MSEWIPITKSIPDKEVLCCNSHKDMLMGYVYADNESNTGYAAESEGCILMDVTAWMPLPKPYREEENRGNANG